jgi:hypothetical protein
MPRLQIGEWSVEVERELLALASARCSLAPFLVEAASPQLFLQRGAIPAGGGRPLNPRRPEGPRLLIQGPVLHVEPPQDALGAELALRAAFHLATVSQGGVLLHASGVAFGGKALVAVGPSGAGKSTFARLARRAGGELLSDEVLSLLPDGRVLGTPFRSDPDMPGTAREARLAGLFALVHAPAESLEPLAPASVVPLLLAQAFRAPSDGLTQAGLLQRVGALASQFPAWRFSFRNHPEAGGYLRRWCEGHAAR